MAKTDLMAQAIGKIEKSRYSRLKINLYGLRKIHSSELMPLQVDTRQNKYKNRSIRVNQRKCGSSGWSWISVLSLFPKVTIISFLMSEMAKQSIMDNFNRHLDCHLWMVIWSHVIIMYMYLVLFLNTVNMTKLMINGNYIRLTIHLSHSFGFKVL